MASYDDLLAEAVAAAGELYGASPTPSAKPKAKARAKKVWTGDTVSSVLADRGFTVKPTIDCPFNVLDEAEVFPEEYHKLIPEVDPHRYVDAETFSRLCLGMHMRKPVFIHGPTGSGKTTEVFQYCALKRQPAFRVNTETDILRSEVMGDMLPVKGGELIWKDGIIPEAVRTGGVLIIDDVTAGPAGFTMFFLALMEGEPLRLIGKVGGEQLVYPHPEFRIVLTDNTLGLGDGTDIYGTRSQLDGAIRNRVGIWIEKDYMPEKHERELLVNKTGIESDDAKLIVDLATLVRGAFKSRSLASVMSPRQTLDVAELMQYTTPRVAYDVTYRGSLTEEDRATFDALYDTVYGHTL